MFKPFTRLLTRNLHRIPLFFVNFDYKKFIANGAKGSCDCIIHPLLEDDEYIIGTINELIDYIRDNYDMDKVI